MYNKHCLLHVEFCCVDTFLIQVFLFSGGADRIIRLWELDNSLCVQEYRGHGDVVRDVKVINVDVFLSASNDW